MVAKEGTEGALPGLGLTEEQLFFIGFAQVGQNKLMIYNYSLSVLLNQVIVFKEFIQLAG